MFGATVALGIICFLFIPNILTTSRAFLPPERPPSVPVDAQWFGGIDGGNFISLSLTATDTYKVVVYTDITGDVEYEGLLKFAGDEKIPNFVENPSYIQGWDGEVLHLGNKGILKIYDE